MYTSKPSWSRCGSPTNYPSLSGLQSPIRLSDKPLEFGEKSKRQVLFQLMLFLFLSMRFLRKFRFCWGLPFPQAHTHIERYKVYFQNIGIFARSVTHPGHGNILVTTSYQQGQQFLPSLPLIRSRYLIGVARDQAPSSNLAHHGDRPLVPSDCMRQATERSRKFLLFTKLQ